jgi:ketosteroid isomerase-like protein
MSGENTEIVRRLLGAFNSRDVEAVIGLLDPEIAFFAPGTGQEVRQPYHHYPGHQGIRLYFDDVKRVWESFRLDPREFTEVGDRVVVLGSVHGQTRSGNMVDRNVAWAWRISNGKIVWGRIYENPDDAFRDTTD